MSFRNFVFHNKIVKWNKTCRRGKDYDQRNEKSKKEKKKTLMLCVTTQLWNVNRWMKYDMLILRRLWSVFAKRNQGYFRRVIFAKWFSPMFAEPQGTCMKAKML